MNRFALHGSEEMISIVGSPKAESSLRVSVGCSIWYSSVQAAVVEYGSNAEDDLLSRSAGKNSKRMQVFEILTR